MCVCGSSGVTNVFPFVSIKYENGISQSSSIPKFLAIFELLENNLITKKFNLENLFKKNLFSLVQSILIKSYPSSLAKSIELSNKSFATPRLLKSLLTQMVLI